MNLGASPRTRVRRVLGVGVVASVALAAALALGGLSSTDAVLLSLLLAGLPALALAQLSLLPPDGIHRASAYLSSIASLVAMGALVLTVGARGRGIQGLGLRAMRPTELVVWTAVLSAVAAVVIILFRALSLRLGHRESPLVRQLMPRTPGEKGLFVGLSASAGLGEEIAYRGYIIAALAPVTGATGAAVIGSAVFGVLHAYQGWLGIPRAALLGGVFAWGYLACGSLWPPVLAHLLVDLLAGLVLSDWLLHESDGAGGASATVAPAPDIGRN